MKMVVASGRCVRLAFALLVAVFMTGGEAMAADEPQPAPSAVSRQRIEQLVRQLGDKNYLARQGAQEELARLSYQAFDALNAAASDDDLEIASRAKYLLKALRVESLAESDPPEVKKRLHNYELDNARSRELRMQGLADLPDGQGTAALCWLVRFENSLPLSKAAAVALLRSQTSADPPNMATIETVRKILKDCKRPGAAWLLAWTRLGSEPEAVMAEWTKFIDDEQSRFGQSANETKQDIITGLIRFQIVWLKKLGKTNETTVAADRLLDMVSDESRTLQELVEWLVDQRVWKAVDHAAQRFASSFAADSFLLYLLAQAYAEQGQKDRAEETAARALGLHPGTMHGHDLNYHFNDLNAHVFAGMQLCQRGLFTWARGEYEYVLAPQQDDGPAAKAANVSLLGGVKASAVTRLAEMLHDQGQDLAAAGTIEKFLAEGAATTEKFLAAGDPEGAARVRRAFHQQDLSGQMNYYLACHWKTKNDVAKQREYLDKALLAKVPGVFDPTEIDVLIACYHLPGQPAEYRAKIKDRIDTMAASLNDTAVLSTGNRIGLNDFARLIANTEGDLDLALECARKVVALTGVHYTLAASVYFAKGNLENGVNTLASVYFAKGDLENAVKWQTKVVELQPHSGLAQRQLELFRAKFKEKNPPSRLP